MAADGEGATASFESFGLDERLLRAVTLLQYAAPTPIQAKGIPLALEGKDVVARARTGSGKTAAYAIPAINKILLWKTANGEEAGIRCLVLVPTRELCKQVKEAFEGLTRFCSDKVSVIHLGGDGPSATQRSQLAALPDIVISTPSRILEHLTAGVVSIRDTLELLVVDEADLLLSYGYEDDMRTLMSHMPNIYQGMLMSATLSAELETLKKLCLHNPVMLKLSDNEITPGSELNQYFVHVDDLEKYLIVYGLLKLKIIKGKVIMFVNSVERGFRLKIFLERFSLKTALVNADLPMNSRYHILQEFNRGMFDYIIATDDSGEVQSEGEDEDGEDNDEEDDEEEDARPKRKRRTDAGAEDVDEEDEGKKKGRGRKRDAQFGVSRGVDFQSVDTVINFDFPTTETAYVHRIGRTGRGTRKGNALSLVSPDEVDLLTDLKQYKQGHPESIIDIKPYSIKVEQFDGLRYRVTDVLQGITKNVIKDARMQELKLELLNSEKLKAHFEENPRDLEALQHAKPLIPSKIQSHLKKIPDYIMPSGLPVGVGGKRKRGHNRGRGRGGRTGGGAGAKVAEVCTAPENDLTNFRTMQKRKKAGNPLKSFGTALRKPVRKPTAAPGK